MLKMTKDVRGRGQLLLRARLPNLKILIELFRVASHHVRLDRGRTAGNGSRADFRADTRPQRYERRD